MNDEILKIAQAEYQRQYNDWVSQEPKKEDVNQLIEGLIRKYQDLEDNDDISPCPKCGCETVVSKNDNWICEKCKEIIV